MKLEIYTSFIRLDQALQFAGFTQTGGESKMLILEEEVMVNGEIETRRGRKLYPGDEVTFGEDTFIIEQEK